MRNFKNSAFKSALDFDARQLRLAKEIIADQKRVLTIIKTAVPRELAVHILHCVISGERLLIYTETANRASQIRFYATDILNIIAISGQVNLKEIQVKLCQHSEYTSTPRLPLLPSVETIKQFSNQFANKDTNDILSNSLLKLAKTLTKRTRS